MSSIRKTPEKAIPALLARLSNFKEHALKVVSGGDDTHSLASKFDCIKSTLQHTKESLVHIKKWETMVVEQLGVLDRGLDDETLSFENASQVGRRLEQIEADAGKLKSLVSVVEYESGKLKSLASMVEYQSVSPSSSKNQLLNDDNDSQSVAADHDHVGEDKVKTISFIIECFDSPVSQLTKCLALLSVFPENVAIKKRSLIYWWIGEGIVTKSRDYTAEEVGEKIFQDLLNHSIINPSTRSSFTVYPWIRRVLIQLSQNNSLLKFSPDETPCSAYGRAFLSQPHAMDINGDNEKEDVVAIYNMNVQYLGKSSLDLLSRPPKLKVLQMGSWQDSPTYFIEADDYEKLLETLGSQKHLIYMSLRGISRVETLPRSIPKLTSLLILDLRACHNLNKLPQEVAELRSLTHLDVSECYLLDSMPNGLQRLSNLQVLKGFVVANSHYSSKSCKINDLAQLPHLRKLGIRVGKEQLGSLAGFRALRILTILWGVADYNPEVSLPTTLIKLDLRSVPFHALPPWMEPSKLPNSEKLYIKGGNLNNLNGHEYVNVKSVRLTYFKSLKINREDLLALFTGLIIAETDKCHEDYSDTIPEAERRDGQLVFP